jgi:iron(III) transport system substrate-binding protein
MTTKAPRCPAQRTRRQLRWRSFALASALLALTLTTALAASPASARSRPAVAIVLYNGQHPQLTQAEVKAFEHKTGINVRVRTNDGVILAEQILEEGSHSPADVYLTENSPELMLLSEHHLLTKLPSSVLSQVPAKYDSPSGYWEGVALRVSCLTYDPKLIRPGQLPAHLADLAEPRWKAKVAIAPTDSDFLPLVGGFIATYGKRAALRWLDGLKANALQYADDESVVAAVNRGQVALGVVNQYYWYRLRAEVGPRNMHSKLYFFPNRDIGGLENISGVGVLASSRHKQAAERFVEFLASAQGQRLLAASEDYEYPVRPGVAANPALPPLSEIKPAVLSVLKLGDDLPAAALLQQAGLT